MDIVLSKNGVKCAVFKICDVQNVFVCCQDAVLKLWDLIKTTIIQTLSLHFPAFSVLGKEVNTTFTLFTLIIKV